MVKFMTAAILGLSMFLLCASIVLADMPPADKAQIRDQVALIENAVNQGDAGPIIDMLSPHAVPNLRGRIEKSVAGKSIFFEQRITSYQDLGDNRVKVTGTFTAQGAGWHVSGFSNYFVFEKVDDFWLLVDTDFHRGLGAGFVWRACGGVGGIIIVVVILIPIGAWAYVNWRRRSRERAALDDLWERYNNRGMDVSRLPANSPEALEPGMGIFRRLVRFFFGGDIGYVRVGGMNYDLVAVRSASAPRRVRSASIAVGPVSYQSTKEEIPIQYHYIVRTGVRDEEALRARLSKKTKGLFSREIVSVDWRGGKLAAALNSQAELITSLMRVLTPKDDIKVVYDRRNSVARIVLTLPAEMRRTGFLFFWSSEFGLRLPSTETADVINRIAGFIRSQELGTEAR